MLLLLPGSWKKSNSRLRHRLRNNQSVAALKKNPRQSRRNQVRPSLAANREVIPAAVQRRLVKNLAARVVANPVPNLAVAMQNRIANLTPTRRERFL